MGAAIRKRINVTLPVPTVRLLDRVAGKGERSRLIDHAVRFFIDRQGRSNLRKLLREGAIHRADRDRMLADEWFQLDNET